MKRADTLHSGADTIRQRLRRITIAGCMFTLFAAITSSPLATAFYLALGATDRDLGLMGGLITATVGLQSLGGMLVNHLSNAITARSWHFAGHHWNNYHAIFAIGLLLRVLTLPLGYRIHEPRSAAPGQVLPSLTDMWPMTWLLMPIRLYRRTFLTNHNL